MKKWVLHILFLLGVTAGFCSASEPDGYSLIKDLASPDETIRGAALGTLTKMGDAAKPILVEVESAEEVPKNLKYFVEALAKAEADHEDPKDIAAARQSIKTIEAARAVLLKVGAGEGLDPRQLYLLRRLLGNLYLKKLDVHPIDITGLIPFGSDKEKKIAGNPDLLFNMEKKIIVMEGEFSIEQGPLEYLIVSKGPNARLHETVAAVFVRPRDICYAMLACAYTYAGELGAEGKVVLPKDAGVMISVEFLWEEPHAKMEPNLDFPGMISLLKTKQENCEKAPEAEHRPLLFDIESDLAVLKVHLDHDLMNDKSGKVEAQNPFLPPFDKERELDDAKRKILIENLAAYARKMIELGVAVESKATMPVKRLVRVPIEMFAWNAQTDNTMKQSPFAFTGSRFEKDENGKPMFMADEEKSIVALKLDPYAVLNTPLDTRDIDPQHAAGYGLNQFVNSKRHARCRIILEPWNGAEWDQKDTGVDKGPAAPPKQ